MEEKELQLDHEDWHEKVSDVDFVAVSEACRKMAIAYRHKRERLGLEAEEVRFQHPNGSIIFSFNISVTNALEIELGVQNLVQTVNVRAPILSDRDPDHQGLVQFHTFREFVEQIDAWYDEEMAL